MNLGYPNIIRIFDSGSTVELSIGSILQWIYVQKTDKFTYVITVQNNMTSIDSHPNLSKSLVG